MSRRPSPAELAATVVGQFDRGGELTFVDVAGGRVHVLAADGDWPALAAREGLARELDDDWILDWALGVCWTVCGRRLARHRGGFEQGAHLVSWFADDRLCRGCAAAFGDRQVVIFEANRVPDDG